MDKALFDFSNTTRKWSKSFQKTTYQVTIAQDMLGNGGDVVEALGMIDQALEDQEALIAEVLVSVPRSWLATSAPELIDWKDPKSLDWIRPDYYSDLLGMLQSGEAFKGEAKN